MQPEPYAKSRLMYIFEAAFEYLISILVGGSFLATLTSGLGMSDSLTGIISGFISLGCVFQIFSMLFQLKRPKKFVTILSLANQCLFTLLYIIPLSPGPKNLKIAGFTAAIFVAYLLYNLAHPKKINWFMSMVDDSRRGIFTANKEIFSLFAGMIFSFGMGFAVDYFKDRGEIKTAYILCAFVIGVLTALHTVSMLLSEQKPVPEEIIPLNPLKKFPAVIKDRNVLKVVIVFSLWYIASYSNTPFYSVYLIKELGFSLKLVSLFSIVYGVIRAASSRIWGRYADKFSFEMMIQKCFIVAAAAFFISIFTVPSNGKILYTLHHSLYAVAQGGINSALINLVFARTSLPLRENALALTQAVSGLIGFLATLTAGAFVSYIQSNGNRLFGVPLYAQQALSAFSFVMTVVVAAYVGLCFKNTKGSKSRDVEKASGNM